MKCTTTTTVGAFHAPTLAGVTEGSTDEPRKPATTSPTENCPDPPQIPWLRDPARGAWRGTSARNFRPCCERPVGVSLTGVDQRTYGEFVDNLDDARLLPRTRAEPSDERFLLDVEPSILHPMIDRCWVAAARTSRRGRPLTEIELRLAGRIVRLFLQECQSAWQGRVELKLEVLQVESSPRLLRVLPSDESVILIGFELALGELRGMMRLCLPCRVLERIGSRTPPESPATTHGPESAALVEVAVTLAETQIAIDELADLRVGDIIGTETAADSPAIVSIEGSAQFRAKPGTYQGRKAVCISEAIEAPAAAPPDQPSA